MAIIEDEYELELTSRLDLCINYNLPRDTHHENIHFLFIIYIFPSVVELQATKPVSTNTKFYPTTLFMTRKLSAFFGGGGKSLG